MRLGRHCGDTHCSASARTLSRDAKEAAHRTTTTARRGARGDGHHSSIHAAAKASDRPSPFTSLGIGRQKSLQSIARLLVPRHPTSGSRSSDVASHRERGLLEFSQHVRAEDRQTGASVTHELRCPKTESSRSAKTSTEVLPHTAAGLGRVWIRR